MSFYPISACQRTIEGNSTVSFIGLWKSPFITWSFLSLKISNVKKQLFTCKHPPVFFHYINRLPCNLHYLPVVPNIYQSTKLRVLKLHHTMEASSNQALPNSKTQSQSDPSSVLYQISDEYTPDRKYWPKNSPISYQYSESCDGTNNTLALLANFNLIAVAARRAQIAIIMRDLEAADI